MIYNLFCLNTSLLSDQHYKKSSIWHFYLGYSIHTLISAMHVQLGKNNEQSKIPERAQAEVGGTFWQDLLPKFTLSSAHFDCVLRKRRDVL